MNRGSVILILGTLLLAWTAAVFLPARHFDFVNWDDFNEVVQNPHLHPPSAQHLKEIWSAPYLRLYAPLSYSAWWVLAWAPGAEKSPQAFHLLNIALHVGCVSLVFSILLACLKSPAAAFGGAALFALHPIQVESVAWVSEMNNLLAALLSLASIRVYLAFRNESDSTRWRQFVLASALYLLALFAKPIAVVTPLVAAILDLGFLRGRWRPLALTLAPWLLAAAVFGWIAHAAQPASAVPLLHRPIIAVDTLAFYCGKLFWPSDLTIDYGRTPARIVSGNLWLSDAALLLMLLVILWLLRRNQRPIVIGACVMLAGLLPVLGLIPFSMQEYSTVSDHFMYLAMLGPAIVAASLLSRLPAKLALPVAAGVAVALAVLTTGQLQIWQNSTSLVKRALAIDPGSAVGNSIVGAEYNRVGQPTRARPYLEAAIARDPTSADFHFNLANVLFETGQYEKAIQEYEASIALYQPPSWRAMNNLGVVYAKLNRQADAMNEFQEVLKLYPDNAEARRNIQVLSAHVPTR